LALPPPVKYDIDFEYFSPNTAGGKVEQLITYAKRRKNPCRGNGKQKLTYFARGMCVDEDPFIFNQKPTQREGFSSVIAVEAESNVWGRTVLPRFKRISLYEFLFISLSEFPFISFS